MYKKFLFDFYPTHLVNTKTTIPLSVGSWRWIYTSTLRITVNFLHHLPPLRGTVLYYYYYLLLPIFNS